MLLSLATLGLYGAYVVLAQGAAVGELVGRPRPRLPTAILLTIVTLGIFPGVYLVVLAFDLQRFSHERATVGRNRLLGASVLGLDVLSLATATGGLAFSPAIVVSVVAWSYGSWLVFKELNLYA